MSASTPANSTAPLARVAILISALMLVAAMGSARAGDKNGQVTALGGTVSATSKGAPLFIPGLPEYPGAHRTVGNADGDGADVTVDLAFFTMKMKAARYQSSDSMEKVLAWYRAKLAATGTVDESTGGPNTNIADFNWKNDPDQRTLAVHGSDNAHIVAMKPTAKGCEFALISMSFK
jgi:hypothetical protein